MRRDMNTIREIMLYLENLDTPPESTSSIDIYEISQSILSKEEPSAKDHSNINHHVEMIVDDDLIIVQGGGISSGSLIYRRISPKGHDFLNSVRDPEIWRKTQEGALAVGGLTFDLFIDLAKGFAKQKVEAWTGVKL